MGNQRPLRIAIATAGLGLLTELAQKLGRPPIAVGEDFTMLVFYLPAICSAIYWVAAKLRLRLGRSSSQA